MRGDLIRHKQVDATGTYTATILDGSQRHDYRLDYAWSSYVADASAANRLVSLVVLDADSNFVFHIHQGDVITDGETWHCYWMPGIYRETAGITTEIGVDGNVQCPVPANFVIPEGYILQIKDVNGTDTGDAVTFHGMFSVLR